MTHMRIKLLVAGVAVAVAVTFLAMSAVKEGWVYYLPVDEFASTEKYHQQRVRLHGMVSTEDLEVSQGLMLAKFNLLGENEHLRIEFNGVVPDQFQADREVVVEGRLDESGTFQADTLLTKCASKYEAEGGEAPHENPRAGEAGG